MDNSEKKIKKLVKIKEEIKNFKVYTDERFPLVKNSLFLLIFTISAYIFSRFIYTKELYENKIYLEWSLRDLMYIIGAFIIIFFFFLQLRITDEFKDYEEDLKYRPYRPVQRGIITLTALRNIGIISVIIQILTAVFIDLRIILFLMAVWLYLFLMTKEFFLEEWLKRRMVIYALSHVVIMVLIAFIPVQSALFNIEKRLFEISENNIELSIFEWRLICFYIVSYLNGIVLEIGRKTRREDEEEKGVETYSKMWGKKKASCILCGIYFIEYVFILTGIFQLVDNGYFIFMSSLLTLIFFISVYFSVKFLKKELSGKIIEDISGIWILTSYMFFGIILYFSILF